MVNLPVASNSSDEPRVPWGERDGSDRQAMLTGILAQVSVEALQGDTVEAILQRIVDCIARCLPVTIASIILLNDAKTHFDTEVWAGCVTLDLPSDLPWPVSLGAAARCVYTGQAQLIADVTADLDYVPGNPDVKSEYLVPISHRTRLHGVLNLESTQTDFFTPEVCAVFDAVALQIAGAVHLARVVSELEVANRKLRCLSLSDGLTGIANRRCFDQHLAEAWRQHASNGKPLALLMADVDCFKALNDASGHLYGDECLRALAALCTEVADGSGAMVARYGGEEIALLVSASDADDARRLGEHLRQRVQALALEHPDSPVAPHVTISIGISVVCPDKTQPPEMLIALADRALYAAKARGRNRVVIAP